LAKKEEREEGGCMRGGMRGGRIRDKREGRSEKERDRKIMAKDKKN
jgi:hypothetical protein